MPVSRRTMLRLAAATPAALSLGAVADLVTAATASADSLGVLLDYAAGVLSAADIKAAGALGSIRYVSDRRPGAEWMLGKPVTIDEARDLYRGGLKIVSNYQFGKRETADWLGGRGGRVACAKRGWDLHRRGRATGAPIYASVDDNPPTSSTETAGCPYLRGWEVGARPSARRRLRQLKGHRLGAAGRSRIMVLAAQLGLAHGTSTRRRTPVRDRRPQGRRRRRGPQQHSQAPIPASGTGSAREIGLPHLAAMAAAPALSRPACICRNTYRLVGYRRPKKIGTIPVNNCGPNYSATAWSGCRVAGHRRSNSGNDSITIGL